MSTLTLAQAQDILQAALGESHKQGFRPMGIVAVDAAGQVKAMVREDGATALRLDIAQGKAAAALGMGMNSRALVQRARDLPAFFATIPAATTQKFIPQTGAVLIQDAAGQVLGAVGASGGTGDEDEQICIAGVAAAGLKHV